MPSNESGGVLNMWFSWNYADVHFVSIDTSTDFPNAPEGKTGKFYLTIFIDLFVRKISLTLLSLIYLFSHHRRLPHALVS